MLGGKGETLRFHQEDSYRNHIPLWGKKRISTFVRCYDSLHFMYTIKVQSAMIREKLFYREIHPIYIHVLVQHTIPQIPLLPHL